MREARVWSLGREDPLEKEMATHSSILAWRIPWWEEPGRLQSTGSQRVRQDWATSLSLSHFVHNITALPWSVIFIFNFPASTWICWSIATYLVFSVLLDIFPTNWLFPKLAQMKMHTHTHTHIHISKTFLSSRNASKSFNLICIYTCSWYLISPV